MTTLFIADLHLDDSRPQITALFERYLASAEVRQAKALYILGDLAMTTTPSCRSASPAPPAACAMPACRCISWPATATSCWATRLPVAPG